MEIKMLTKDSMQQLIPLFDAYRIFYRKQSDKEGAELFLKTRLDNSECIIFGAFNDEKMVGFTLLYPLFSSVRMRPIYLLNDLFVEPEARNLSVGKTLLYHVQKFAKDQGYAGVLLETEKTNEIGNHLYPSVGFHLEESSNFYFWENVN